MMHYGPWIQHQGVLDNHRCYGQYIEDIPNYRLRSEQLEEENELTGDEMHDTTTSATSGERSTSADLFRLEFAATQWSKLVLNAEGLFNKLVKSNILPHNEQDQIEQWLCMKQEYEECIASDDSASLQGFAENARRSLERIEEVTETDEKTDESINRSQFRNESESSLVSESEVLEEEDEEEEEDESDENSDNPDFLEKLDECMNKFKIQTDRFVDSKKDSFKEAPVAIESSTVESLNNSNHFVPILKPVPIRNPNLRRNSMLPGSEMCNGVLAFNGAFKPCQNANIDDKMAVFDAAIVAVNRESKISIADEENVAGVQKDNSPDLLIDVPKTSDVREPVKALKTLVLNNEVKQTQMKKILSDLESGHKRKDELQTTIHIKERFIADMIKNRDIRVNVKQRLQRGKNKLEEEYYNAKTQLALADNASSYRDFEEKATHKKEIELYENMAAYKKRMMDMELIKQIAGDSTKKVLELESSLNTSKRQMEKLKRQMKKEEERKKQLEDELVKDQRKIHELEVKYNLTASKLREIQSESEDERSNDKSRNDCCDKKKNLLEVSARISHLDHVLKEKSMDLERTADTDEKEALRHEIRNLRSTRDRLVEEKCDLDVKFQKERTLTTVEERKLLECGETIEAIDAMIEHKNEMICGRKSFDENQVKQEISEELLTGLSKLSDGEMITLFYKYYCKVIDLKESSKTLDNEAGELLALIEKQGKIILTLFNALKQTMDEADQRIILMQREHEEKLHLMSRNYAEETGSSGHERLDRDSELAKYRRENRSLRKQLANIEAQEMKPIKSNVEPKTRVIRTGKKLIIEKTKDRDKRKM